ncbi:MAG: potassium channel family protein [Bdellovibrionales bacterium]
MIKKIHRHHQFMSRYALKLVKSFLRPASLFLGLLAISALMLGSLLFYSFEHEVNNKVETYFDAIYFGVTLMTSVGLGDISPVTVGGKMVAMFMMICGTGIFVSFTAVLATTLIEIEDQQIREHNRNSDDK